MTQDVVIGIGELEVSKEYGQTLKTLALGSCIALTISDPVRRVTGLAHIVFPKSDPKDVSPKPPGYYADKAVPEIMNRFKSMGSGPRLGPISVKIIGGSNPNGTSFNIGKRNILAVRKALFRYGIAPGAEDTGGTLSRSVYIKVGDIEVKITSPDRQEVTL